MTILDVNKLAKSFGYGQLFKDLSFSLNEGESISIVGANGCGKSTILKIIAGLEGADKGSVNIKKNAKVAYLDQTSSSVKDDRLVYEILKDSFGELNTIEKQLTEMQSILESNVEEINYTTILEKYCKLIEVFSTAGGYDMDMNINTVIYGLNLDKNLLGKKYNDLSGGEKTLIQLAKTLIIKPDLILLDEPTNHLDIKRIEWLEEYIKSFKGASVIVSHDRYFLDRMSSKILAIDDGVGKVYSTNYSGYLCERQRDFEKQMAEYKEQQLTMEKLKQQRDHFAQLGMGRNSSTLTKQASVLGERLARMQENAIKKPKEKKSLNVGFAEDRKSSKKIIITEGLTITTPDGNIILNGIDLDICAGERVAILGANGTGKSTFVKTIMGVQDLPVQGKWIVGLGVKIGYLPQIIDFPNGEEQLLEYFSKAVCLGEQKVRQILAGFQFYSDDVNKRVKNLSGGERMRVKLAELLQQQINTLIFDEPTNHIDIPTKEVLEESLEDFGGTLIFISHDRYFINKFADKIIEFEDGKATIYLGNYDDYKERKQILSKVQ